MLTYYVLFGKRIPAAAALAEAKKGQKVKTVQGESVGLSFKSGKIVLNGAARVRGDRRREGLERRRPRHQRRDRPAVAVAAGGTGTDAVDRPQHPRPATRTSGRSFRSSRRPAPSRRSQPPARSPSSRRPTRRSRSSRRRRRQPTRPSSPTPRCSRRCSPTTSSPGTSRAPRRSSSCTAERHRQAPRGPADLALAEGLNAAPQRQRHRRHRQHPGDERCDPRHRHRDRSAAAVGLARRPGNIPPGSKTAVGLASTPKPGVTSEYRCPFPQVRVQTRQEVRGMDNRALRRGNALPGALHAAQAVAAPSCFPPTSRFPSPAPSWRASRGADCRSRTLLLPPPNRLACRRIPVALSPSTMFLVALPLCRGMLRGAPAAGVSTRSVSGSSIPFRRR